MAVNATHNKTIMVVTPFGRYSKVFIADMQILGSAFCFGIGFLGQRAVMVRHPVVIRRRGPLIHRGSYIPSTTTSCSDPLRCMA